jgi:hypothetical protein
MTGDEVSAQAQNRVHTEEVTGSSPASPTQTIGLTTSHWLVRTVPQSRPSGPRRDDS